MKTIILSAGQGRRLLPMTAHAPKCTLTVGDRSVIEWQIDTLLEYGIDTISVVAGYGADHLRELLEPRYDPGVVRILYNPLFKVSDNLVSCWFARHEMNEEFILLNGDTLFEIEALDNLIEAPLRPVTLATNEKNSYDQDDMKVSLEGTRVVRIGKDLPAQLVDAESIGMTLFREEGVACFREVLEQAIRGPEAFRQWYLSAIETMARSELVWSQCLRGPQWLEIDDLADLELARTLVPNWSSRKQELPLVGSAC